MLKSLAIAFLSAAKLCASVIAAAGCGEPPAFSNHSGDTQASASASCQLSPKLGYVSDGHAQSSATLQGNSASISVQQQAAYAYGFIEADYTLFVTGGSGIGRFKLLASGAYSADYTDTAYYYLTFGGTQLSGYTNAFSGSLERVANLYETFPYDTPILLHLSMTTGVAEYVNDRRSGNASVSFSGVSIVNSDGSPNAGAVALLQLTSEAATSATLQTARLTPEPTYQIFFGLLALIVLTRNSIK